MTSASRARLSALAVCVSLHACGGGGGGGAVQPDVVTPPTIALPAAQVEGLTGLYIDRDATGAITSVSAGGGAELSIVRNPDGSLTVDALGGDVGVYTDVSYQDPAKPYAHYARLAPGKSYDLYFMGKTTGLSYTEYGLWAVSFFPFFGQDAIVMGFDAGNKTLTPIASMPPSGSATYSGGMIGRAYNLQDQATYMLTGRFTLNANFSSQTISGSMTGISAENVATHTVSSFNDIGITANVSGNGFTGTAAASNAPGGPAALAGGASGSSAGHFYGPAAQEAAGTWYLKDANNDWAVGAFGAKR